MSMTHSRYNAIRIRLIYLFNIVNNREYPLWVAPKTLMSVAELRDRYTVNNEGSLADHNYFEEHQVRRMTVPAIIDILPNVTSSNDLGFSNGDVAVLEIFESIQEYISLWCELIRHAPEFGSPPISELRYLETMAWHIFPVYKELKPFKLNADIERQMAEDRLLNRRGLMTLGILFDYDQKSKDISFVSHIDSLDSRDVVTVDEIYSTQRMMEQTISPPQGVTDSLATLESSVDTSEWLFRG